MTRNVYSPDRDGSAQEQYADQMDSAYVGMLAETSDINLVDTFIADPSVSPDGLAAGIGVVEVESAHPTRSGVNQSLAAEPGETTTTADFAGIIVRNQRMATNAGGLPCAFAGDACNVLRSSRVGGRIWLMLSHGSSSFQSKAYWIVSDKTGHGCRIGSFSAAAIASGDDVDTVELANVRFLGAYSAPGGSFVAAKAEILG